MAEAVQDAELSQSWIVRSFPRATALSSGHDQPAGFSVPRRGSWSEWALLTSTKQQVL